LGINIFANKIFDILVAGGLLLLLANSQDTGWRLIGLGVLGFFAYVLIKKARF
jgi:hypothetical protein